MLNKGFVVLDRKIMNWRWWDDDAVYRFFTGLIMIANYQDMEYHSTIIKRGSLVTSIPHLCEQFKMTDWKVRRCLKCLSETGEIIDSSTNKGRLITIVKYDEYQSAFLPSQKPKGKPKGKPQDKPQDRPQDKPNPIKQYNNTTTSLQEVVVEQKKSRSACVPDGHTAGDKTKAEFDYDTVDWSIVQRFKAEDYGTLWGEIPYKPICKFSRACNASDYDAGDFYALFRDSGTLFPPFWEKVYVRYINATSTQQEEFKQKLYSGEYKEKWKT